MSDAVDQARDLLADPPIGVEVWGPIVEGLLDEMSEVQAEVQDRDDALVDVRNGLKAARVDFAKARNVIEQVRDYAVNSSRISRAAETDLLAILDEAERGEGS